MIYCPNSDCAQPRNDKRSSFCSHCGTPLLIGDRFILTELIEEHGQSFLAVDQHLPSTPRCVVTQRGELSVEDGWSQAQFSRLEGLGSQGHLPEFMALLSCPVAKGRSTTSHQLLVHAWIEGESLAQRIARDGAIDELTLRHYLDQVLADLVQIHDQGFIHGDIRPSTLICRSADQRLIAASYRDIAPIPETARAAMGRTQDLQVLQYWAPERRLGQSVPASDIYSLGVTAIQLLTAQPLEQLFDLAEDCWCWEDSLEAELSEGMRALLNVMLERATRRRYSSAVDVLRDLAHLDDLDDLAELEEPIAPIQPDLSIQSLPVATTLQIATLPLDTLPLDDDDSYEAVGQNVAADDTTAELKESEIETLPLKTQSSEQSNARAFHLIRNALQESEALSEKAALPEESALSGSEPLLEEAELPNCETLSEEDTLTEKDAASEEDASSEKDVVSDHGASPGDDSHLETETSQENLEEAGAEELAVLEQILADVSAQNLESSELAEPFPEQDLSEPDSLDLELENALENASDEEDPSQSVATASDEPEEIKSEEIKSEDIIYLSIPNLEEMSREAAAAAEPVVISLVGPTGRGAGDAVGAPLGVVTEAIETSNPTAPSVEQSPNLPLEQSVEASSAIASQESFPSSEEGDPDGVDVVAPTEQLGTPPIESLEEVTSSHLVALPPVDSVDDPTVSSQESEQRISPRRSSQNTRQLVAKILTNPLTVPIGGLVQKLARRHSADGTPYRPWEIMQSLKQLARIPDNQLTFATQLVEMADFYRDRIRQGHRELRHLTIAIVSYEQALTNLQDHPERWPQTCHDLGRMYLDLSRQHPSYCVECLEKSVATYQLGLAEVSVDDPTYLALQNQLGEAYSALAANTAPQENWQGAIAAYQAALVVCPAEMPDPRAEQEIPRNEEHGSIQNNLGTALWNLSLHSAEGKASEQLRQAIAAYNAALAHHDPDGDPVRFGMIQNNLGTAYLNLSQQEQSIDLLRLATGTYQVALMYRKRDEVPLAHAATQNNLGAASLQLAGHIYADPQTQQESLDQSIIAYDAALKLMRELSTVGALSFGFDPAASRLNLALAHQRRACLKDSGQENSSVIFAHLETAMQINLSLLEKQPEGSEIREMALENLGQIMHHLSEHLQIADNHPLLTQVPNHVIAEMSQQFQRQLQQVS